MITRRLTCAPRLLPDANAARNAKMRIEHHRPAKHRLEGRAHHRLPKTLQQETVAMMRLPRPDLQMGIAACLDAPTYNSWVDQQATSPRCDKHSTNARARKSRRFLPYPMQHAPPPSASATKTSWAAQQLATACTDRALCRNPLGHASNWGATALREITCACGRRLTYGRLGASAGPKRNEPK